MSCKDESGFLDELNYYFGRFEALNYTTVQKSALHPGNVAFCLTATDVHRTLSNINMRKVARPDNIPGWLLRVCGPACLGSNRHF